MISRSARSETKTNQTNASNELAIGLQNRWYGVAFSSQLQKNKVMPMSLFEEKLILFRNAHGKVTCVKDFCPHRGSSFKEGKVVDGSLVCPYHHARYTTSPDKLTVNCTHFVDASYDEHRQKMDLYQYPCEEMDDCIFVYYTGEMQKNIEDFGELPPLETKRHHFDLSSYTFTDVPVDYEADWTSVLDNLLDVLHLFCIHNKTHPSKLVKNQGVKSFDVRYDCHPNYLKCSFYFKDDPAQEFITTVFIPPNRIFTFRETDKKPQMLQIDIVPFSRTQSRLLIRFYRTFLQSPMAALLTMIEDKLIANTYQVAGEDYAVIQQVTYNMHMGYIKNNIFPLPEDSLNKRFYIWYWKSIAKQNPYSQTHSKANADNKDFATHFTPFQQNYPWVNPKPYYQMRAKYYIKLVSGIAIIGLAGWAVYKCFTWVL